MPIGVKKEVIDMADMGWSRYIAGLEDAALEGCKYIRDILGLDTSDISSIDCDSEPCKYICDISDDYLGTLKTVKAPFCFVKKEHYQLIKETDKGWIFLRK